MNRIVIFLIFVGSFVNVFSQKTEKAFKEAQLYYSYGDYRAALEKHYEIYKQDSLHIKNNYFLGVCYLETMQNEKALEIFKKIKYFRVQNKKLFIEYDFYHDVYRSNHYMYNYGRALHLNHHFKDAIKYYQTFLRILTNQNKSKKYNVVRQFVKKQIEMCKNGIQLMKNPVMAVHIENMGEKINSEYDDIAPLLDINEHVLVFTSRRPHNDSTEKQNVDLNHEYMEDIYMSVKDTEEDWHEPFRMENDVNTDYHDAGVGLSSSGCHLFIYRNNNIGTGDIYETHINDEGVWSKPEKLADGINTKHTESNAMISSDERKMFFTSDRPGMGKSDIYFVEKTEEGVWGIPVLLDDHINTSESEESPFISHDGMTLYFSSKGHNSMGGYDIFKSEYNEQTKEWSKAENLGYPINTADNDVYFVWTENGHHAYFSSHHEDSYGENDLYFMTIDTTFSEKECRAPAYFIHYDKKNNNIFGDDTLYIETNVDDIYVDSSLPVTFTAKFTSGKMYEFDHAFWKFGNTQYDCHEQGSTVYHKAGKYNVVLVMYIKHEGKMHRLKVNHKVRVFNRPEGMKLTSDNTKLKEDKKSEDKKSEDKKSE